MLLLSLGSLFLTSAHDTPVLKRRVEDNIPDHGINRPGV
jgi:hypothetical protein